MLLILSFSTFFSELLLNSNIYMQQFNIWPPFVVIGIFMTTISAALGNLIGASRILQALARDRLFCKSVLKILLQISEHLELLT